MAEKYVLLVDDHEVVARTLARALKRWGYHPEIADSADAAIGRLPDHDWHAVISDFMLGSGRDGCDVLAHAARITPASQRVLLSGSADHNRIAAAVEDGTVSWALEKPTNLDVLRRIVEGDGDILRSTDGVHGLRSHLSA